MELPELLKISCEYERTKLMPESCWSAIRTREMHIGFRYSFFFQISKNPTLPIFWLSACSALICSNSSVTSLLFPRKNCSDFLAPPRSPLDTRKMGDLGIQNIQRPSTAGNTIQMPEKSRQSVLQFKLTKKMPRVTISCIHVPKAPRYFVSAISAI